MPRAPPMVGKIQAMGLSPSVARQPVGSSRFQPGSWVCLSCGNVNFPARTSCNAKSCGRSRCDVDGGPPKADADIRSVILPGSWVCTACGNINWSTRTECHKKKCGKPRAEVDGGAPTPAVMQAKAGSWTCRHCINLNFPERRVCNRKTCGKPRDEEEEDESGRATPESM
eukprot:TRINITY_DN14541_c0_g1_i6.p2 TRINITY_DN14541_c0_g1~~TRINITY_DN14541_c0_g1_i6.p2  ORF type:complete len:170 (-),score=16.03 TRINITY_DN14541_c0_g1_i6:330-839(-)